MAEIRTYKYRLKDRRAAASLRGHAFQCNQIWNWCVAQHKDAIDRYRSGAPRRKWLGHFDLAKTFNGYGKKIGLHQQTIGAVSEQWVRHRSMRFRSSYGTGRALGWIPFQKQARKIDGNSIRYLGKWYRFFGSKRRPLPGTVKGGCFVEDTLGRWWVCFHIEIEVSPARLVGEVGVDLGLKSFAVLSDGRKIAAPQFYRCYEDRLAVAQRTNNKQRVRRIHTKIKNCRLDFLHKLSTNLAGQNSLIAVGNVNAKQLAKTRMSKSVIDAGWSAFRAMLKYKAAGYVEVDERFTTQTCSECGALPPERPKGIAGLGIRSWGCSECGASHDRDVNAARNILTIALSAQRPVEESRISAQ